jgi:membrane protein YqaA with SNARE-associated domain
MPQTWILALAGLLLGLATGFILDEGAKRYIQSRTENDSKSSVLLVYGLKFIAIVIVFLLVFRWIPLLLGTGAGILIEKQWFIIRMVHSIKKSKGKEGK